MKTMQRVETKIQKTGVIIGEIKRLMEGGKLKERELIEGIMDWQRWRRLKMGKGELSYWEGVELLRVLGYRVKVYKPEEVLIGNNF